MAPRAVQADLSDDEFSSGASSASGSGSDSEAGPAGEDAAAGNDPSKGKQGRAASDCPSQGSIDCSQELREGPPGEGAAEGDTAASNGTSDGDQEGGAAEGRDNGTKQSLGDGTAGDDDDDEPAQTGMEKKQKKKRRRLSKRQPGELHAHLLNIPGLCLEV